MDRFLAVALCLALLTACGSGSDSSGRQSTTGDAYLDFCTPGGLWRAADGGVAIIGQSLEVHIVQPSGVQYVGTVDGEGWIGAKDARCWLDPDNSTLHAALPIGTSLPDGSVGAKGNVDGSWQRRQGMMTISGRLTTSAGGMLLLSFDGTYDPLFEAGAKTARLTGTYRPTTAPTAEVVTIDSNGNIFGQNAANGCVLTGSIAPVDPEYNTYRLTVDYANCTGATAVLNGNRARGLGYLDTSKSPAELFIALDVNAPTQHYSLVQTLQRL
jgi:hypothetical protein